jgi:membrane-associated HD superfamily phosphohydrolase
MIIPKTSRRDKQTSFLSPHREDLIVVGIWVFSLIPAFLISVFKNDPFYASVITILIQFMASFGSITLFGVICQLICYHYIESSDVHDRMMDGLFYGFHVGMIIWVLYAFFRMMFGQRTVGEINALIGFFGIMCILSCMVGILCGFIVGHWEDRKRNKGF